MKAGKIRKVTVIGFIDQANPVLSGIMTKMNSQKQAFSSFGYDSELITLKSNAIVSQDGQILKILSPIGKRLQFFTFLSAYLTADEHLPDLVYIRYPFSTPAFLGFLKALKDKNPSVISVIEIPTLPYEEEFAGLHKWKYYLDQFMAKDLRNFVDLAVVIGNKSPFQGIKTMFLTNGVNVPDVTFVEKTKQDRFTMVAMGNWRFWHGLDRVLVGLAQHIRKSNAPDVVLYIIGEGESLSQYKEFVDKNGLRSFVEFSGPMSEEDAGLICRTAHVGIGVLGSHRKGLHVHAPLKHRTYAAQGLPFVYSTSDPDFDTLPFILKLKANNTAVNIGSLIRFVKNQPWKSSDIYGHARKNLSWKSKMKEVLDHF